MAGAAVADGQQPCACVEALIIQRILPVTAAVVAPAAVQERGEHGEAPCEG